MRIGVVGAGISGLSAGWLLTKAGHDVTVFEAEDRLGGHAHTRRIDYDGKPISVDTGFIVLNDRNYPNLNQFFELLDVVTAPSEMGFAVSIDEGRLEYSGGSMSQVFAQKRNLVSPRFLRMTLDILRFFRQGKSLLENTDTRYDPSLGDWLRDNRYSQVFIDDHLLPMGAAIWSTPVAIMNAFPARSFLRFFLNHGLLSLNNRPQWRTVLGGSRVYVSRVAEAFGEKVRTSHKAVAMSRLPHGVQMRFDTGQSEVFDHVVTGVHGADLADLITDKDDEEATILSAFKKTENKMYLHRDPALMPKDPKVWSSWNYIAHRDWDGERAVSLSYWMNALQPLPPECPIFVTLNPKEPPRKDLTFKTSTYYHPMFDHAAMAAQKTLPQIQGRGGLWYAGAWGGYGFHEDGLKSGIAVARALGAEVPWTTEVEPATDRWTYANAPAEAAD